MEKEPEQQKTRRIAGVHFSKASKIERYLAGNIELSLHDFVVIKGDHGEVVGQVVTLPRDEPASSVATNIKPILRKATNTDIDKYHQDMEKALEAYDLCEKKILERDLYMKLVDVSFEDNKAIFFFFAEERVDFRALVKDLASSLHMRIEMRQIGARDEAKAIGSMGPCGIVCCCETYLQEFKPISITMAKNQGLSPNPAKLTGMCGKLKCCLNYENETYLNERKDLPPIGAKVKIKEGDGIITNLDILKHLCSVRVDNEDGYEEVRCKCSDCQVLSKPRGSQKKTKEKEKVREEKETKKDEKLEG
ncbi:MAG: stage 0 sporulation protein [Deltaproteobacteria bacterium CG11_big_fil_rev_8_21_14_0_20_49_13]|nr:MAG: stage 0 sporulation protein [Deltaproteobacteria bacterium CG11_big_fil_rev_8_21_14_0_20_49_13]